MGYYDSYGYGHGASAGPGIGLILVLLLILAGVLVLNYFIAKQFHQIASQKGHPQRKYFWWSFWLGLVGYLMVVALPDRAQTPPSPAGQMHTAPAAEQLPDL